jgi:hypothetical protein
MNLVPYLLFRYSTAYKNLKILNFIPYLVLASLFIGGQTQAAFGNTLTNVTSSSVTTTTALTTWNTSLPSTSQTEYGFTTAYGTLSAKNSTYSTSHSVKLSGLQPGTTYHFRILTVSNQGYLTKSNDHSFTTSSSGTPVSGGVPSSYFGMHMWSQALPSWPGIGFGQVRLWDAQVAWNQIETSRGSYNWSKFDTWISLAQQHNVGLMYTFGHTPIWSNSAGSGTKPPDNLQDWDDFVRAIATRSAGRVKVWEVWNEPNASNFWTGSNAQLVEMARRAYNIIKSLDPNAIVVSPVPQGGSAYQWMDGYLAAGGGAYANVIAFHGYVSPSSVESSLTTLINNMQSVMTKYGQQNKPLWNTEASWGQNSSYPDYNAEASITARMLLLQYPKVARFYWYGWDQSTWGTLWWWTGGQRPAGVAYNEVHRWMVGNTMNPCSVSGTVWTCNLTRPDGSTGRIVWNSAGTSTYNTGYTKYHTITSASGAISGSVSIGTAPKLLDNN